MTRASSSLRPQTFALGLLLVGVLTLLGTRPVSGQSPEVSFPVTVSTDAGNSQQLTLGLDSSATAGIDAQLGETEQPPLPPSGVFDARLIDDDIAASGFGEGLLLDVRNGSSGFGGTKVHEIQYQPGSAADSVTLAWQLPANVSGTLEDQASGGSQVRESMTSTGSVTLTDLSIRTFTVTLDYVEPNSAPTSQSDSYTATEGQTLSVSAPGVLGNDSDPDSDSLTASLVSTPSNGSVTLNADGSFDYTPDANFVGTDEFSYAASDGRASDTSPVTITVEPQSTGPITVDGDLSESEYTAVPQNDTADGFPRSELGSIYYHVDETNGILYVATAGTLTTDGALGTPHQHGLWINVKGSGAPAGRSAGNSLGIDAAAAGNAYVNGDGSGNNLDFRADFEVDFMTSVRTVSANPDSLTTAVIGDHTTDPSSVVTFDTTDQAGTAATDQAGTGIDYAFRNRDGSATGAEWRIPLSAIGASSSSEIEVFAFLSDRGAYFSNEIIPGDGTKFIGENVSGFGDGNVGTNPDWGALASTYGETWHFTLGTGDNNDPPVAVADSFKTKKGQTLSVSAPGVLGNDSDPNRDALTASLVSGPTSGTLTLNADGSFEYTADSSFAGDSFRYAAADSGGKSDTATVKIKVNGAPTARPDSFAAEAGKTLTVSTPGVLGNDDDPEGESLSATFVSGASAGSLTLNADGSFEYTASSSFAGDSFRYAASDPGGSADTATVELGVNQAPTARADSFQARAGKTLSLTAQTGVLANDSDPEGSALTASQVSGPSNGSLTLNANGSLEYTPDSSFSGTDSFRYAAADQFGVPDTATATIEVVSSDVFLVDGRADDPNYRLLGTSADAADGFSEGNDLDSLFVYPDDQDSTLYVAAVGTLQTTAFNGYGIWLNVTGPNAPSGAPAGTDLGFDTSTNFHYLSGDQGGTNADFQADFQVDFATGLGFLDSGSLTAQFADYSGTPSVETLDTLDQNGTPGGSGNIEVAFLNTDGPQTGAEWKIPYSAIGASPDSEFEVFGVIVSATGFFSNETIPGDGTQISGINPGNNAQWDDFPGGPYHDKLGNQPPIAVADSFVTEVGDTLSVSAPGVLFNDGDPDDDPVSLSLLADVSNGSLTLNSDGSFDYEPNADFTGTDSFTYQISAGGETDTATATLDVRLPAPTGLATALAGDSIQVTWSAPSAGTVDRYRIYRDTASIDPATDPSPDTTVSAGVTTLFDTDVATGTTYFYRVTAVDAQGKASAFSAEARRLFEVPSASATATVSGDGDVEFGDTGTSISFSGVSGSGDVTVNQFDGSPSDTSGINRTNVSDYRVTIEAGGSLRFDSTVVKFAVSNLRGVTDPSAVSIFKRDTAGTGSFTELATRVNTNGTSGDISDDTLLATTGSFSEFAFASDSEPLPVELARFGGETTDGGARLRWRTASEQNNAGFRIQRRVEDAEANPWTKVGFVESKAPGGTTSESNRYRFTDEDLPFAADSVSYRLVQIDVGGSVVYSDPITLDRGAVQTLQLKAPYPNPARNRVKVPFAVPEGPAEADVSIRLYDILGRRIQTVKAQAAPGRHRHVLEVNDLASGVYFLRLRAGDAFETRKVTVVR